MTPSTTSPDKERARAGLGIKAANIFERTKVLVKQIKALGVSQAGLPFMLDVPVTPESMSQTL